MLIFFVLLVIQYFVANKSIETIYLVSHRFLPHPIPYIILALVFFPGTVVHEFAHFITALILFLKVRGISLLPEWADNHLIFGHVSYERADFLRGFVVGIAPLPAGLAILWLSYSWLIQNGGDQWHYLLFFYITFTVSSLMFSSKSDLTEGAAFVIFIGVFIGGLLLFSVDVWGGIQSFLANKEAQAFIQPFFTLMNLFLAVSLGIHLVIIAFFRILFRGIFRHHR